MSKSPPVISLLTDFGRIDPYVGVMHGVILGICPTARIVDLTHAIPQGGIAAASFVWDTALEVFGPDSIHVAVVDPGVGTGRRILAVRTRRGTLIAPDNGILERPLLAGGIEAAVSVENPALFRPTVSATFHGRDIFAPVAAHLAEGRPLESLGPGVDLARLRPGPPDALPDPRSRAGSIRWIDRFGNAISDVRLPEGARVRTVRAGPVELEGLARTYADVAVSESLALVGSSGYLEISVRDGSAREALGLEIGQDVEVELEEPGPESGA